MGEVSALPRQPLLGATADALAKAKRVAEAMSGSSLGVILEALIGKKPEMAEDAAYGFPPLQGAGQTLGPKTEYAADIADLLPWVGAAKAGGKVAGAMAKQAALEPWMIPGTKAAQEGAIRLGGNPNLMMSHAAQAEDITPGGKLISELYGPSLAITDKSKSRTFNPYLEGGDKNVLFIPKVGAFNPQNSPSTLLNRDAWTRMITDYSGFAAKDYTTPQQLAAARLRDRTDPRAAKDVRWSKDPYEIYVEPSSIEEPTAVAVNQSPAFSSFKHYENSPVGAKLLSGRASEFRRAESNYNSLLGELQDRLGKSGKGLDYEGLVKLAKGGDLHAQSLLHFARKYPSDYAELKVHGPVPLNAEHWAGAVIPRYIEPRGFLSDSQQLVMEQLRERGIPSRFYQAPASENPGMVFNLMEELQKLAGPFGSNPL